MLSGAAVRKRVKRRRFYVIPSVVLLLLAAGRLPVAAQTAAGADAARSQADEFLKQASQLNTPGSSAVSSLVASALQLAPDYSEALYARARIAMADRGTTMEGIADLRAAIRSASWRTSDPSEAELLLGQALLRTGNLAEARGVALHLVNLRPEDGRNLLLLARTLERSRDTAGEQKTLSDAAVRFPEMDEFRLLAAALRERQGRRAEAVTAIATGLRYHPDSLPLLLAAARLERAPAKQVAAVALYAGKDGTDPLADVMGLESAPASQKQAFLTSFLGHAGLGRQDLIDRVVAAVKSSKTLSAAFQSALIAYSGSRDLDADRDGYWEDRWQLDAGRITRWTREPAENGVAQYASDFTSGMPATLSYTAAGNFRVTLTFSRYPFIEKAAVGGGSTYFVVPYTLQCAFLQTAASGAFSGLSPRIASRIVTPTVDQLRRGSSHSEDYAADGVTLLRHLSLARGMPVFMEEDVNGDGRMDHRVWFANGTPIRGERSLGGSSLFAVKETWKDGKLLSDITDTDGDGRPDFRETYGGNSMKAWDYNEDGKDDCREFPGPGGTTLREISSALNGVFDVRIRTQDGRIVEVTKAGVEEKVSGDAARGVTWIGTPAAPGAAPDLSAPDGVQALGSRSYLVFRSAGITYAEEVK